MMTTLLKHRPVRWTAYALLALLTLECCPRLEDSLRQQAPMNRPHNIDSVFHDSPEGRQGRPGARFAKWSMNSLGYRSPEPRPDSSVRILTFGASETFGLYESAGNEYPRQLERELQRRGLSNAEVINIALPGIRIGHADYLREAIARLQPQWVLLYPSPANYIGAENTLCREGAATRPVRMTPSPEQMAPPPPQLHLRLAGKLTDIVKPLLPLQMTVALKRLSIQRFEARGEVMDRLPDEQMNRFLSDLSCTARVAESMGARPLLVTHATRFGPGFERGDGLMLTNWRSFYPELREDGLLDMERRAAAGMRALAQARGLPLVDASAEIPGGAENFADFVHFTDAGAQRMATLVADTLTDTIRRGQVRPQVVASVAVPQ